MTSYTVAYSGMDWDKKQRGNMPIPKGKGYIPFGLNKLSSSLPLSCIIARLVQVVKVQR
jgi:hypothetical protein